MILSLVQLYGQTKILEIPFGSEKSIDLSKIKELRRGELFQIKISGINMNLYNVSIDKKDSTIKSEVTIPDIKSIAIDGIKIFLENLSTNTIAKVKDKSDSVTSDFKSNQYSRPDLKKLASLENNKIEIEFEIKETKVMLRKRNIELQILKSSKKSAKSKVQFEKYLREESSLNNAIDDLQYIVDSKRLLLDLVIKQIMSADKYKVIRSEVINRLENYHFMVQKSLSSVLDTINGLNSLIISIQKQSILYLTNQHPEVVFKNRFTVNQALDRFTELNIYNKKVYNDLNKSYDDIMIISLNDENFKSFKEKEPDLYKEQVDSITKVTLRAKNEIKSIIDSISNSNIISLIKALLFLENNASHEYLSLPMQYTEDISKINLSITPKSTETGLQQYSTALQVPTSSFYAGVSASFYYNGFHNMAFSIIDTTLSDTTSKYRIVNENLSKGEVGLAALLHVGFTPGNGILGFHASIGPALSLSSHPQPRLGVGLGVSIGVFKSKLTIDFLSMSGFVEEQSNSYAEGKYYTGKPQPIVSRFRGTFGISLGYIYKF